MAGSHAIRAERAPSSPTPIQVEVLLTAADTLSATARVALMRETESIWLRHGVAIHWLPPTDQKVPGHYRLRALVIEKRTIPSSGGAFGVGELISLPGNHPIAFVSIEDAQRLVNDARGSMGPDLMVLEQRRLGITLGRALAHEIGHFLLRTSTHARSGLMRSRFNAAEFTDLRDGTFALDQDAADWLHRRDVETFAYAQR